MPEPLREEKGPGVAACGRVTRLSTTPVKGFGLHHPDAILLQRTGAAGDREFFVIDGCDRLVSIWKTGRLVQFRAVHEASSGRITLSLGGAEVCGAAARPGAPVLADFYGKRKVAGTVVEGPWNAVLTDAAGEPMRLVRADEPSAGHDEHPVTLLGEESVAEIARQSSAGSVDARRFRMLIAFCGLAAHAEDSWQAGRLRSEKPWSAPAARCRAALRRRATPTTAPVISRLCG